MDEAHPASRLLARLADVRVLAGQHRIALSPDGAAVAYAVRRAHGDPEPESGFYPSGAPLLARGCTLLVTDSASAETACPLPDPSARSWRPSWAPDSRRLAFYADAGGRVRLHVWDRAGDGPPRAYPEPAVRCRGHAADRPRWSPDGAALYLPLCPPGLEGAFAGGTAGPEPQPIVLRAGAAAEPALEEGRRRWGADVGRVDAATGAVERLTSGLPVAEPHLSPNGRWLAFYTLSRAEPAAGDGAEACDLYVLRAAGGEPLPLAVGLPGSSHRRHRPAWGPDGSRLAFLREGRPFVADLHAAPGRPEPWGDPPEAADERYLAWTPDAAALLVRGRSGALWRVPAAGKPVRIAVPDGWVPSRPLQPEAGDAAASWRGGLLVPARAADGATARLFGLPAVGAARVLWEDAAEITAQPFHETWHWFADVTAEGDVAVHARETAAEPADLWCWRSGDGRDAGPTPARRLTELNPGLSAPGRREVVRFRTPGPGGESRGLLWLPCSGEPPFPAVVILHPDLAPSAAPCRFEPEAAAGFAAAHLVARGLAVWMPDFSWPSGDRDRGEAVAWDAAAAADAAVAAGWLDPARLTVAGYGLGGFAALSLLLRTDRFRAAAVTAAIVDWSAYFGDLQVWQGAPDTFAAGQCEAVLGAAGGPWADPWRYVRASPLYALDRLRTPVLVIAGGEPAPGGAGALFAGLHRLGREAVLLRYPREVGEAPFHWRPEAFRDVARRIAEWLVAAVG